MTDIEKQAIKDFVDMMGKQYEIWRAKLDALSGHGSLAKDQFLYGLLSV